ncbi:MAG: 23S rRNA (guanosine(2251)-2'-O)-methyltransferase RlmB [Candidatus Hydrogenedentota bacterium]
MAGRIIYGVNAVREALDAGRRVNRVYLARESRARGFQAVVDRARANGVPFDFVPQAKLNELAETREHQGVAAAVSPVAYANLDQVLGACPAQATLLVLDQVQHPKNVGMLIRAAAGAGAVGVVAPVRGAALVDDTVLRASAGTALRLPLVACKNLRQALQTLRKADFWLYALEAGGGQEVFLMDWPARVALVVGNESSGLRPGVRKLCDEAVAIPLSNGVESLNAALAAGIALFQVAAQRRREA